MEVYIVVGNYFKDFLRHKQVLSIKDFLHHLASGTVTPEAYYFFGQGIDEQEFADIRRYTKDEKILNALPPSHAPLKTTHKHKVHNNMVSHPVQLEKDFYEMQILIDDQNDIMADHLTGQHIQGILILEAARQAWTVVTEVFYLTHNDKKYRFVIEKINSNFKYFIFPVPILITIRILEHKEESLVQFFTVAIDFFQDNKSVARVEATYKLIEQELIEKQEALASKTVLSSLMRECLQ